MSYRCVVCLTVLTQCLALKQISVMQGDTLILKCPLKNYNMSDVVEWRNPEDLHLFFNRQKGKNTAWATIQYIVLLIMKKLSIMMVLSC